MEPTFLTFISLNSTFVIIFYIYLPNLCGCKSKNNKSFFFFFASQIYDYFFFFLFSFPPHFQTYIRKSVFLYFSPPFFSFRLFLFLSLLSIATRQIVKTVWFFFVNKYRCWGICKRWSFKEFSYPTDWLAFQSLSFMKIFQSPTFIT